MFLNKKNFKNFLHFVSYFEQKDDFSFDSNGNVFNINKGALGFSANIQSYEFRVETLYLNTAYNQIFSIEVDPNSLNVPIANLK